jgi:hypothetical protein
VTAVGQASDAVARDEVGDIDIQLSESARVAVPPQINVVGAAIFLVAVGGMLLNVVWENRRTRLGA